MIYRQLRIPLQLIAACALVLLTMSLSERAESNPEITVVIAAPEEAGRHIGYGISAGPHLPSRPDLLDRMGMDWVMLYSTSQLNDYPLQSVLYRVDFPPNPDDRDAWVRGLTPLAKELDSRGVDAVQLGNEPNLAFEWFGHRMDPKYFTEAMCLGYRAFKEAAPNIIIVGAGIASTITTPGGEAMTDFDFTQLMFNYGGGNCFDALAYHPYGYNQPPEADPSKNELVFRRTERMYSLMWKNGIRDKQIWITEFGWVRDPAEAGKEYCYNEPGFRDFTWIKFPQDVQAIYTARAFRFAESNWPWVGPMILWNLNWNGYKQDDLDPCTHMRWYSVLDENDQPLPVVDAITTTPKVPLPPVERNPAVGAVVQGMTHSAEAGCAGATRVGSFTVRNSGYSGLLDVEVEAANGPTRPVVWTSTQRAESGTEVEVFVDATGIEPGLHLIAVNLRTIGTARLSSHVVRGWLLIHYPTSPECVARYGG